MLLDLENGSIGSFKSYISKMKVLSQESLKILAFRSFFNEIITDRATKRRTDQPTDLPTDMVAHREITLPLIGEILLVFYGTVNILVDKDK